LTIKSGLRTPIAEIPTPDLAVPYAAPKQVKTMADVQPIAPKKGYQYKVSFRKQSARTGKRVLKEGCMEESLQFIGLS
jgi:hypothetical protein